VHAAGPWRTAPPIVSAKTGRRTSRRVRRLQKPPRPLVPPRPPRHHLKTSAMIPAAPQYARWSSSLARAARERKPGSRCRHSGAQAKNLRTERPSAALLLVSGGESPPLTAAPGHGHCIGVLVRLRRIFGLRRPAHRHTGAHTMSQAVLRKVPRQPRRLSVRIHCCIATRRPTLSPLTPPAPFASRLYPRCCTGWKATGAWTFGTGPPRHSMVGS
jgi:hypothetical protein